MRRSESQYLKNILVNFERDYSTMVIWTSIAKISAKPRNGFAWFQFLKMLPRQTLLKFPNPKRQAEPRQTGLSA